MLVVISDLHLEEEASNMIPADGQHPDLAFHRNIPAEPYRLLIRQLAAEAVRNNAERLDLVLAGDIFDIHRTGLWFWENPENLRPYVNTNDVTPQLEAMVLRILEGIMAEVHVRDVLPVLQLLARGRFINHDGDEEPFPKPITVHYLPGNHDRLLNATPALRQAVRRALGLPHGDEPFTHVLTFAEEGALVRHGHEYDFTNFAFDHRATGTLPVHLPIEQYQAAPFGDFATIDLATRLPYMFRRCHGDDVILGDRILRALYLRLLEFDDLRPITAVFNYFLYADSEGIGHATAWQAIEPVILQLLEDLHDDPFLNGWLERFDRKGRLEVIDAIQALLGLKPWRWARGIPLGLAQSLATRALENSVGRPGAERFAARESVIQEDVFRFVVAGHTHHPQVALIKQDSGGERYYVDTGTWRNRVPSTPDFRGFGRLKALTYAILYGASEDRAVTSEDGVKVSSFDFWSGVTQGWVRDAYGMRTMGRSR